MTRARLRNPQHLRKFRFEYSLAEPPLGGRYQAKRISARKDSVQSLVDATEANCVGLSQRARIHVRGNTCCRHTRSCGTLRSTQGGVMNGRDQPLETARHPIRCRNFSEKFRRVQAADITRSSTLAKPANPRTERWRSAQIIRARPGILRSARASAQMPDSVPVNTIANLMNAGHE